MGGGDLTGANRAQSPDLNSNRISKLVGMSGITFWCGILGESCSPHNVSVLREGFLSTGGSGKVGGRQGVCKPGLLGG